MIVSISGRPAATSEPKARTRIASVTGQEISSDFSIASRLASLKSAHMAAAPVRFASVPGPAAAAISGLRRSAAATISFGPRAAVPTTIAVRPSAEIDAPGRGGMTAPTAGSAASTRSTPATVRWSRGALVPVPEEWTATWSA